MTLKRTAQFTGIVALLFVNALIIVSMGSYQVQGSTITGQDYMATSTAGSSIYGAKTTSEVIKVGFGSLNSVVITGANTGVFNFYNATTSNVNLRTGQKATSTILIASFPASATAQDYSFDVEFSDGLYLDLISGSLPTSTITYR